MTVIQVPTMVSGWFRMAAVRLDADGNVIATRELASFPNLVTDQGLNFMGGSANYLARFAVGTGASAPSPGDTNLGAQVAFQAVSSTGRSFGATTSAPYYAWSIDVARFPAGSATGNLSEIGIGTATNPVQLFSRALILDGSGSPTTVTVLPDEALDVSYELRNYFDTSDVPFGISISGITYSCVMRPVSVTASGRASAMGNGVAYSGFALTGSTYRNPASLASVTATAPNGVQDQSLTSSPVWAAYANNSRYRDVTLTWGLGGGATSGLGAIRVDGVFGGWQISFSPSIPKDATKILTLTFRFGPWSRYTIP